MRKILMTFFILSVVQLLIGQDTTCTSIDTNLCYISAPFLTFNTFGIEKKWESESNISFNQTPILIDIDDNCIPEIIVNNESKILIIDSENGTTLKEITVPMLPLFSPSKCVTGDVNGDYIPEIFIATSEFGNANNLQGKLICYDADGNLLWVSDDRFDLYGAKKTYAGSLGLTDFNQDGISDIYINNKIFNADNGIKLLDGGINGIGTDLSVSIAAQLDNDVSDIELVAGYSIYKIDITNLGGLAGNTIIPYNIMIDNEYKDGYTVVSDIDLDKKLDVVVSAPGNNTGATLYVYSFNGSSSQLIAKATLPGIETSVGVPSVGKIVGSEDLSIIITRPYKLLCYKYDGTNTLKLIWSLNTTDASGSTGVTLFDLNNDGIQEIIYRDETDLKIINATTNTPIELTSVSCTSPTGLENPIVGGFKSSGQANICVPCGNKLTVFGSPDSLPPWAPARGIWNQFNYNPLFINDDLTVPRVMKNPATYKNGKYNNFFVQESLLDEDGMYLQKAANLTGIIHCVNYNAVMGEYTVIFDLYNLSDASLDAQDNLSVTFYNGDPEIDGDLLGVYHTLDTIPSGEDLLSLEYSFSTPVLTQLYMAINTEKSTNSSFEDEDFDLLECDYTDNILVAMDIPMLSSIDSDICDGDSYDFYGTMLDIAGSYIHSITDVQGCDSAVVSLVLNVSDTIHVDLTNIVCDQYEWNDSLYENSGTYTYQSVSGNGCDSIVTLDLTIHLSTSSAMTQMTCDSFSWNGALFTESGIYQYNTTNIQGCDSIASLDLTINTSSDIFINHAACDGYIWNNQTYTQSGTYLYSGTTTKGCDSTVSLELVITDKITQLDTISICEGDSIELFGQWVGEETQLSESYIVQSGCDSIQTIQVVVDSLPQGVLVISICEGDSIFIVDRWYWEVGVFEIFKTNVDACDSMYQLSITERELYSSKDTILLCQRDTVEVFGFKITEGGTVEQSYLGSNYCDSTAYVTVMMLPIPSSDIAINLCPGDSVLINGSWILASGVYEEIFSASNGCDSLVRNEILLLEQPEEPTYDIDCEALQTITNIDLTDDWQITWSNGATVENTSYTEGGIISVELFYAPDCYETYTLDLPELPIISEIPYFPDTMIDPSNSISLSTGLDETIWSVDWSPVSIIDCSDCMDVVIHPTNDVEISLSLTHISGCVFTKEFSILVSEADQKFDVPNIFSPNDDGDNDIWKVSLPNHISKILEGAIYDRWGNQIASWQNTNEISWDGTFKGTLVHPNVFVYYLKYATEGVDGSKIIIKKGDVTVLR